VTRVVVEVERVVVRGTGRLEAEAVRLQVERAAARELGRISAVSAHAPAAAGAVAARVSSAVARGGRRG